MKCCYKYRFCRGSWFDLGFFLTTEIQMSECGLKCTPPQVSPNQPVGGATVRLIRNNVQSVLGFRRSTVSAAYTECIHCQYIYIF